MNYFKRLVADEAIVAYVMLALIVTNLDARDLARGTPAYIDRAGGALDTLNALLLFCAVTLLYKIGVQQSVTRWAFALLTLPMAVFIAATVLYTINVPDVSKAGIPFFVGFYVLLIRRAWARDKGTT